MEASEYLAGHQAARLLGVTPQRVAQLAGAGRLPYVSTALGRLYPREGVERLRRERERPAPGAA